MISIAGHFIPWRQCCSTYITTTSYRCPVHDINCMPLYPLALVLFHVHNHTALFQDRPYPSSWTSTTRCPSSSRQSSPSCIRFWVDCGQLPTQTLSSFSASALGWSVLLSVLKMRSFLLLSPCFRVELAQRVCLCHTRQDSSGLHLDLVQWVCLCHTRQDSMQRFAS